MRKAYILLQISPREHEIVTKWLFEVDNDKPHRCLISVSLANISSVCGLVLALIYLLWTYIRPHILPSIGNTEREFSRVCKQTGTPAKMATIAHTSLHKHMNSYHTFTECIKPTQYNIIIVTQVTPFNTKAWKSPPFQSSTQCASVFSFTLK